MKFKLTAGAELDLLTKDEFHQALKDVARDWMVEATRGPKVIDWYASGTVTSAATVSIGGEDIDTGAGRIGPATGMVWSIKRFNVQGLGAGDKLSAWRDVANPQRSIMDGITGFNSFSSDALVLRSGTRLLFTGASLAAAAGTVITVAGAAWELPQQLMYKLM